MSRRLCWLLVVVVLGGTALANDAPESSPTPEQVNENPQMYVGKILVFDHMTLLGKPRTAPRAKIFRFIVSTEKTEFLPPIKDDQRIFFGTPDKGELANTFSQSLSADQKYLVRMTCEILKRGENEFIASVRRIDLIRYEHPSKPEGQVEQATIEDVVKEPAKYVGKTLIFDRMEFTGKRKNRPARFSFAVKSPSGTNLAENHSEQQSVIFATPDKGAEVKRYIKEGSSDLNRPLRFVCEFLKVGEGKYIASIKRIDLLGYNYDGPQIKKLTEKKKETTAVKANQEKPTNESANANKSELEGAGKKHPDAPTKLGRKVELKNNIELYYTSAITKDEVRSLGNFLENWKDQGRVIFVQIAKEGKTYQFRMPVKKGLDQDQHVIRQMRSFAKELSRSVFDGASVDIHLCDEKFKTLRVVIPLDD